MYRETPGGLQAAAGQPGGSVACVACLVNGPNCPIPLSLTPPTDKVNCLQVRPPRRPDALDASQPEFCSAGLFKKSILEGDVILKENRDQFLKNIRCISGSITLYYKRPKCWSKIGLKPFILFVRRYCNRRIA